MPFIAAFIFCNAVFGQVVSPFQGGHYSPGVINIRDMATPPQGLFLLWYNSYVSSTKYFDRDGNEFNKIRLDQIHPANKNPEPMIILDRVSGLTPYRNTHISTWWQTNQRFHAWTYL